MAMLGFRPVARFPGPSLGVSVSHLSATREPWAFLFHVSQKDVEFILIRNRPQRPISHHGKVVSSAPHGLLGASAGTSGGRSPPCDHPSAARGGLQGGIDDPAGKDKGLVGLAKRAHGGGTAHTGAFLQLALGERVAAHAQFVAQVEASVATCRDRGPREMMRAAR